MGAKGTREPNPSREPILSNPNFTNWTDDISLYEMYHPPLSILSNTTMGPGGTGTCGVNQRPNKHFPASSPCHRPLMNYCWFRWHKDMWLKPMSRQACHTIQPLISRSARGGNRNQAVWRTCLHLALGNLLNINIFSEIWLFLLVNYAN